MGDTPRFGDYVTTRRLGAGGQAATFLAHHRDRPDDVVLVKVFHVAAADDWKSAELFERSARVLERLEHRFIPAYRDHFELQDGFDTRLCLVRDFVEGESLQARIDRGGSYDEATVIQLGLNLLDVLEYLHGLDPPVIHRDIKPANIIVTADGTPRLVDFGAVQAEILDETGGSTIVGTAGYVSPEQLMGRAEPASDLYALGVTLVHLLTGVPPTELPTNGFELELNDKLSTSPELAYIVGRMTRADIDERESDIGRLRRQLETLAEGGALVVHATTLPVRLPVGSRLEVSEEDAAVVVRSPPALVWNSTGAIMDWVRNANSDRVFPGIYGIVLFLGFLVAAALGGVATYALLPALAVAMIIGFAVSVFRRPVELVLGEEELSIWKPFFMAESEPLIELAQAEEGPVGRIVVRWEHLRSVEIIRTPTGILALDLSFDEARVGKRRRRRGSSSAHITLGLSHGEYIWLRRLLNARLEQYRELHPSSGES